MKLKKRILALLCAAVILLCAFPAALAAEYIGVINEESVFFRTAPNTDAAFYYRLTKDTKVTVTGTKGDFYAVTIDKVKGYVMKKFVTLSAQDEAAMNVSTSAYANASAIDQLGKAPAASKKGDSGEKVEKLQQALKIKHFYDGKVDGLYGDNTVKAVKSYQKSVGLSQTGAANSTTIARLFNLATATPKAAASPKPTATPKAAGSGLNGITKISQIPVPATSRKGDSGNHVKYLQQALKLKGFYSDAIDGVYGKDTESAVSSFQKSVNLARDGVAGNATIRALFGKNASNYSTATPAPTKKVYKTERLDWFNGGSNRIPKKATFTVKDVATGKTFTCRRWSGANHLDAEPLTEQDTATMKSIYGGSWSWSRRAILVKYDGRVYAASMNGMPHGTTTISDNNFNGHFCIHFYNSRTHESNKVDKDHQNCVARAMNATW